ncbi:FtsX-like permease family protein [Coprobacter tertius]|uniref:FtsX-like permease family protein n=1 Tax=Coprobacter tertius TaxID=2944915 RepID=A0ABT1ME42_9BACT|nr:FtsX-like permease family protein [Coprobacter tertius]MCP9610636.1 FtsX-like permease family protein [Coprobacter tertius]
MGLSFTIARRYLFSKKSHSAINTISIVSVCGVAITTMALICTLSVYNGFQDLIASLYSTLDPQVKIELVKGKTFDTSQPVFGEVEKWPEIEEWSPVLEENVLLVYRDKQMPALMKGVPDNFGKLTQIDRILLDGEFMLRDSIVRYATIGVGVANRLEAGAHYLHPLKVYAPRRKGKVNMANPAASFNEGTLFTTAVFSVNQPEYDDQVAIVPLDFAREILDYKTEASAIEIKLVDGVNEKAFIDKLQSRLGIGFVVKDRMQQQETSFRMMQIEKWMTFLILAFILMIATFNVIGSLSMLIIDKKDDIKTLQSMGADDKLISRIFLTEGWLISAIGAGLGLAVGILLCFLQQEFGLLRLGQTAGAFVVDSYPVKIEWIDSVAVLLVVAILGFLAAWYPVKYLRKKLL